MALTYRLHALSLKRANYEVRFMLKAPSPIRRLVEKVLATKQLTPALENAINDELTRLGYVSEIDYEALELLMEFMDEGLVRLVPSKPAF
jgi:hypothetical protein